VEAHVNQTTRKALLLYFGINEIEKHQVESDLSLVCAFLKSAEGGCFSDDEIVTTSTDQIEQKDLIAFIDSVDFSFIYFSGHSHFENRLIYIPLKNEGFIKESDLIRPEKKQWIFLDTCRSNGLSPKSPEFSIPRRIQGFTQPTEVSRLNWFKEVSELKAFYLICYTTELGGTAYSNELGGFGTQLFFAMLLEQRSKFAHTDLESVIKGCVAHEYQINQRMNFINGNASLDSVPFVF
jgi:hypothetical protein